MLALIAAAVCGFAGYKVLERKGYKTPLVGLYLGIFLGIIGVLICYIFFDEVE